MRAAGGLVSFDPNVRKELLSLPDVGPTLRWMQEQADLLLPSEADLEHLCPGLSEDEAALVRDALARLPEKRSMKS